MESSQLASARPERRPRIAHVTSARGVGAAEKLTTALLAEGTRRGWEQLVLHPFGDSESQAAMLREWPAAQYESRECSTFLELVKLRLWLAQKLAEFKPDIVHVSLFHASVLMATLPRRGERRVLTHAYGDGLAQLSFPRLRNVLDRWAGRSFDHVSAVSDSVKRFLEQEHGYPPPALSRIVLGWQGDVLPAKPAATQSPTIVCVALLRPEKDHATLLKAFKCVRGGVPNARLVLVGDGPCRAELESAVRAAGLEESVHITGFVPDTWPYLADASVFALASPTDLGRATQVPNAHKYWHQNAVMEALAAGLPAVVAAVGGLPDFIEEGITGELFEYGNHEELAHKLIALIRDPERLTRMSTAARSAAAELHIDVAATEYFALFDELLRHQGKWYGSVRCSRKSRV